MYIYIYVYGGFHKWEYPKINGYGKTIYKWMMTGGTPISGNLHIYNTIIYNIIIYNIYVYIYIIYYT